jgi:hypothetical protein
VILIAEFLPPNRMSDIYAAGRVCRTQDRLGLGRVSTNTLTASLASTRRDGLCLSPTRHHVAVLMTEVDSVVTPTSGVSTEDTPPDADAPPDPEDG